MNSKQDRVSITENALRELVKEALEPIKPTLDVVRDDEEEAVKEALRMKIRSIIEAMDKDDDDDDDGEEYEWEGGEKSYHMTHGASWEEIMHAMGATTPSKHRRDVLNMLDPRTFKKSDPSTLQYAAWLAKFEPNRFDEMHADAVEDYIDFLITSGELDEEDIDYLKSNKLAVQDLEGFREYWQNELHEDYLDSPSGVKAKKFFMQEKPLYVDQYGKKSEKEQVKKEPKKPVEKKEKKEKEEEKSEGNWWDNL